MSKNKFFNDKTRPLVLGHRGVPKLHQENTISGFKRAVEMGLDGVEFDVYLTKDNKCVIFHDENTESLTGIKGNISEMTFDEVSKLRISTSIDMGDGNIIKYDREERIPLLEEVLEEFKDNLLMDIELKAYYPKWSERHLGTEVARIVRKTGSENKIISTSFNFFMLYYLEKEYPDLHSGFAYDDDMIGILGKWTRLKNLDVKFTNFLLESNLVGRLIKSTVIALEHTLIDSDTISKFHRKNMIVGTYTLYPLDTHAVRNKSADQEQILTKLISYGVDWIETDEPDKVMNLLDKMN